MYITQSHITIQVLRVFDSFERDVKANKALQGSVSDETIHQSLQLSFSSHSAQLHALTLLVLAVSAPDSIDIAQDIRNVQLQLQHYYNKVVDSFSLTFHSPTN